MLQLWPSQTHRSRVAVLFTGNFKSRPYRGAGPGLKLYDLPLTSLTDDGPMPLPKIDAFVEGVCVREALLDTGAAVNILNSALVPKWMTLEPAPATLFAAN